MTTPNSTYIECSGLFKIYKAAELEVVALRGLELTVGEGEIIAIVGASGSGKSTLLNILAGYDAPSAGTVRVGNYDLLQMTNRRLSNTDATRSGLSGRRRHETCSHTSVPWKTWSSRW